jgi:tetratricopeptide (TPR) repeat protein
VGRAIARFEEAIALDPLFADAYAGLAHACFERAVPLGIDLGVAGARELLSKGKAAAHLALSADATLAEAHAALGMILLFRDWDWQCSEQALERALEFGPNSWLAHAFRGVLASTVLDGARTVNEMRRAIELDPLNLLLRAEAGECCFWIRNYPLAVAFASQTLELDSSYPRAHFVLGRVREAEGRIAEAINEYTSAGVITNGVEAARRALRRGGPAGYYRWVLRAGITGMPGGTFQGKRPFFRARAYARLGENRHVMQCLEEAYEQRDCLLVLLKANEWWDPLRADPRFTALVRRVGIP